MTAETKPKERWRGYVFRLRPTDAQADALAGYVGVCRLVYNLALEQRRDFWRQYQARTGRFLNAMRQSLEIKDLRREFPWIEAVPSVAVNYALRDLDDAYRAFFAGRKGYPTYRKRGVHDSFRIGVKDSGVRLLNAKWAEVRIPKLGWVKFRLTRPLSAGLHNVTFSHRGGVWTVSLACVTEALSPAPSLLPAVGVDRGVAQTVTLSTGEHLNAPELAPLMTRQKRAQRVLARRKKGSARRAKQRQRVTRLGARRVAIMKDWSHRTSLDLASRFGVVAVEDLAIKNMVAAGRHKAGLNRSILEQSWGRLTTFLNYKLNDRGGVLISVPAAYTSQTCASCGVVDAQSRKSQAVFACVHCGHTDNADVNAAKEILRRSSAWLDVEAGVARPSKRQPEGRQHV